MTSMSNSLPRFDVSSNATEFVQGLAIKSALLLNAEKICIEYFLDHN